jgi:6-phosphogluconolactonase/glucosamine-6-phosphate isomerase/deaminase
MDAEVGRPARAARVHRLRDPRAVAEAAARFLASSIQSAISSSGKCRIALAGGNTPRLMYERLSEPDLASEIGWSGLHVFFGDERMVPPDDALSNYRMARESLFERVPIAPENVHRIRGELDPINAARVVVLVVTGESKAARVAQVFQERATGAARLPAARVAPRHGELHWFLDAAARSVLEAETRER